MSPAEARDYHARDRVLLTKGINPVTHIKPFALY
ncbi:hypothetical protein [Acinetobacter baumannii]